MATLVSPANSSPHEDAQTLHKACQGWGSNEKAIISILGHRNAAQRKQIRIAYEELFKEDLIKRLESELSGDFEKAVYRWMLEKEEREAVLANVALKKPKDDYAVVVELACVSSPEELLAVRRVYQARYKLSLEEDLAAHSTSHLRQLLVSLVSTYRYNGDEINASLAKQEAETLHNAIKQKEFHHEEVIRILSTRSKAQLVATFNRYKDDHGISITKDFPAEGGNEVTGALRTAIKCIIDPQKYYEKILRDAIKKDKDAVTRVMVRRAEKDLKEIKELYHKRNNVPLEDAISKGTSGDYKAFLLALLGRSD